MKISENNIENIINININIQGVFSNNIEQDIVNVVVGLLNQQGVKVEGRTLIDQLMALAEKSNTKDLDLNIPIDNSLNLNKLSEKLQEAISAGTKDSSPKNSEVTNEVDT